MKEYINALDEIHKGACMGKDAISFVLEKADDNEFKDELDKEYNDYDEISKRIEEVYPKYNEGKPHETGTMNKAMTWGTVEMKTMTDSTTSKLAELIMQGVNMGIIEGRRMLNKKDLDEEINDIVSKYVSMQEESVERLKKYL